MSLLWGVFYTSGLVAYALYKDCDPLTSGKIEKPDQIIPYMVTDKLNHLTGMPGLFVAAVYGGVLRYARKFRLLLWREGRHLLKLAIIDFDNILFRGK